jgi:hypothetical protein
MTMTSSHNDDAELALRMKLKEDFPFYAAAALKIRTKDGSVVPFILNREQLYIHSRLEKQKATIGMVRALILKGRQQGCSTYVGGRYYHHTTHFRGFQTFILTHETEATANLFNMVQRYHDNNYPQLKPSTSRSNAKELVFDKIDSGYRVGTAGTKGKGRSSTVQLFHGSEVAFWPHAEDHAAGMLQTIPKVPGTESILETTANGMGNYFHRQWVMATNRLSEYIPIFIPWYWQTEYKERLPEGFVLDADEVEYMESHDLTLEQMAWRRSKIRELGSGVLFKQEYPATPEEAFQVSGVVSFIKPEIVVKARRQPDRRPYGAVLCGFDPSRDGDDRDSIIFRQGPNAFSLIYTKFPDFPARLAKCIQILRSTTPHVDMLYIDYGGGGYELGGMLKEKGYGSRVRIINSGEAANNSEIYANRRAEMYGELKGWLEDKDDPPSIPDDDSLQADICAAGFKYDSKTRYLLESKEDIKKRIQLSPDGGDALALTFAEPFIREHVMGGSSGPDMLETAYKPF